MTPEQTTREQGRKHVTFTQAKQNSGSSLLEYLSEQGSIAKAKVVEFYEMMKEPLPYSKKIGDADGDAENTEEAPTWTSNFLPKQLLDRMPIKGEIISSIAELFPKTNYSLTQAAYRGDLSSMRQVISTEKANEIEDEMSNFTPLHLAARAGHYEAVMLLLEYGANPNAQDSWNGTPFHAACAMGHLDCVIAMLKNGINKADYNALNNFAQTPLDLALKHRQEEVVHRLRYLEAETGQVAIERILRLQKTKKQERVRNGVSSEEEQSGWLETFYDWTY